MEGGIAGTPPPPRPLREQRPRQSTRRCCFRQIWGFWLSQVRGGGARRTRRFRGRIAATLGPAHTPPREPRTPAGGRRAMDWGRVQRASGGRLRSISPLEDVEVNGRVSVSFRGRPDDLLLRSVFRILRSPVRPPVGTQPGHGSVETVAYSGGGGGVWFGLGQGLCRTPWPMVSTRLCADTTGLGESRLSGPKACRTVDRPRTPWWHTREGDAAVPVCVARAGQEGGACMLVALAGHDGSHGCAAPGPARWRRCRSSVSGFPNCGLVRPCRRL